MLVCHKQGVVLKKLAHGQVQTDIRSQGRPRHVADGETDTTGGSIVLPMEEGQSALG